MKVVLSFVVFTLLGFTEPGPKPREPTPQELAELVTKSYGERSRLDFVSEVESIRPFPSRLRCEMQQGLNWSALRVYEIGFDKNELIYDFRSVELPVIGVLIYEHNWRAREKGVYCLSSEEFHNYARWDIRYPKDIESCRFGGYLKSWVGKGSERIAIYSKKIASGRLVGKESLNGDECWVIQTGTEERGERFFIDDVGRIRCWTTDLSIKRDRVFFY